MLRLTLLIITNLFVLTLFGQITNQIESRETEKQRLDSIITESYDSEQWNTDKSEYIYDTNGNLILYTTYDSNTDTQEWIAISTNTPTAPMAAKHCISNIYGIIPMDG